MIKPLFPTAGLLALLSATGAVYADDAAMPDMPGMDHGAMPGMDHTPSTNRNPATPAHRDRRQSRTPIPPVTDADRAAVYHEGAGHEMLDTGLHSYLLIDQLEWQDANASRGLNWNASGWVGGDIDRLWLRTEGERSQGRTEKAEVQAFWGHAVSPWWNVLGGLRQDFTPGHPQTWAALGVQGQPLYGLETEATAYLSDGGQAAARLETEYDVRLTQRWILQPRVELNAYTRDDPARRLGAGLADSEMGLRLRYEVRKAFAPYVGVNWRRAYGQTASYVERDGEDRAQMQWVVGVRVWF